MKASAKTTAFLLIGIIIIINLLASEYHLRIDLTEDRQYTLSDATEDILEDLEEPVTVTAYFSRNLPPNIGKTRQDFQDLLIEYANLSDGQVLYKFINPNENEDHEKEAAQKGIQPVLINVREKDQMKQQKAFLGATIQLGERMEVIPFVQPGAGMEYALSTAIKKISIANKPVVGFIRGHGEPGVNEMGQAVEQLGVLYDVQEIFLTDTTSILDSYRTLALIRPTDSVPSSHLEQLDAFLTRGGRLLVAQNAVQVDYRSMYGTAQPTGLKSWLAGKGIEVMENFVIDAQCGSVTVPQSFGSFTLQANVSFPYVPVIRTFSNHPITTGLESVMLEFASEILVKGDSSRNITALAFSSELSNSRPAPQMIDVNREWTENDFTMKNIPVAVALQDNNSKLVVIGDGDFAINGMSQQPRKLQPDNVNFLSNAVDWLSDDTGLIELRTKGASSRPIREMENATKVGLKYINFLLPILLAIGYGMVRAQKNRMTRTKRMAENYEGA